MPQDSPRENRPSASFNIILTVSLTFTVLEWGDRTRQQSLILDFFPALDKSANWIAFGLLITTLLSFICSKAVRNFIAHYAFQWLAKSPAVKWPPAKKALVEKFMLAIPIMIASFLFLKAAIIAMHDLMAASRLIIFGYVLTFIASIVGMIRIPKVLEPDEAGVKNTGGVIYLDENLTNLLINISQVVAYVLDKSTGIWTRQKTSLIILNGAPVIIFKPVGPFTADILIDDQRFKVTTKLTINILLSKFPKILDNNYIENIKTLFSADMTLKTQLMSNAAGALSKQFETRAIALFGIPEQGQGQYLFPNTSAVIKENGQKTIKSVMGPDYTLMARKLAMAFSSCFFGAGVTHKIFKITLGSATLEFKHPFDALDKTMLEENIWKTRLGLTTYSKAVLSTAKNSAKSSTPNIEVIENLRKDILGITLTKQDDKVPQDSKPPSPLVISVNGKLES